MEAQKKLYILEGDIGVFSYSVHRHAKGHVDVNHKRSSWFVGIAGHKIQYMSVY